MTTNLISNLTSQQQSLAIILSEQKQMSTLQQQLASGKKATDISQLDPTDTRRLLDLRAQESQRTAYQQTIATVQARTGAQDQGLTTIGNIASQMLDFIGQASNFSVSNGENLSAQATGYLQQVQSVLNQQVDGRYLYAGSRYTTQPVTDLKSLLTTDNPPSQPYPYTAATTPALAYYDTEAVAGTATDAKAYDQSSAIIDNNVTATYGISSNDPAFQNLVLGLRWAYAASQDQTNYSADMQKAQALISTAQNQLTGLQAANAVNQNLLKTTNDNHTTYLAALQGDEDTLQKADSNAVAAQITALESQIEASYTVTAKIANLSLANYLS